MADEPRESILKKIKRTFFSGVLFFALIGFIVAILHPQTLIDGGKLVLGFFPGITISFFTILAACIALIFLAGIPIYWGRNTLLRRVPLVKEIGEFQTALENGEIVEATFPFGLRYYGVAQKGWQSFADDEFVVIYRPHTTLVTGENFGAERRLVTLSQMTKKQFVSFIATGGQVRSKREGPKV
ncbi:MAG: hypothetical protein Q7S28_01260 [bacterium]|nr:hypothetical protein [bacterium]